MPYVFFRNVFFICVVIFKGAFYKHLQNRNYRSTFDQTELKILGSESFARWLVSLALALAQELELVLELALALELDLELALALELVLVLALG